MYPERAGGSRRFRRSCIISEGSCTYYPQWAEEGAHLGHKACYKTEFPRDGTEGTLADDTVFEDIDDAGKQFDHGCLRKLSR